MMSTKEWKLIQNKDEVKDKAEKNSHLFEYHIEAFKHIIQEAFNAGYETAQLHQELLKETK